MLNRLRIPAAGILALVVFVVGCGSDTDLEMSRRFQAAEERFAAATDKSDFEEAAALYQEILDEGFVSGIVLYNQGNAWMQAGHVGRAIASYRQAARILPRDPYLDANLNLALTQVGASAQRPILDYVLFWQQSLSYGEKISLTTLLFAVTLALWLAAQAGIRAVLLRRVGYVVLTATVLVSASAARDWWSIEQTVHGVVVVSESTARKGSSESYEPAFNKPVTEGTEFVVIDRKDGWLHARIAAVGTGWLPERHCVTW